MLAIINGCSLFGLIGTPIRVEVDVSAGLPAFDIVGLPDAALKESRERVRTALKNAGFEFPLQRITVNLAPADVKKEGAGFDLPIALGILLATGQIIPAHDLSNYAFAGALSLEGTLQPIHGAMVMATSLYEKGITDFILPYANREEAACSKATVYGVQDLQELAAFLQDKIKLMPTIVDLNQLLAEPTNNLPDMADVKGQDGVKRALEIAAAGGHNIILVGPPGSGKTMLARRLPSILPELTLEESLELTRIYSVAGLLPEGQALMNRRPFRTPHHGASAASIIGGGRIPRPGEVSLAQHGVLFLDEMPEFSRDVLEALRQPLEDRHISVTRVGGRVDFPATFQLVGAMNPCPCGYYGDMERVCRCTGAQLARYFSRLSGPLLDRVDIHMQVPRMHYEALNSKRIPEPSVVIRQRVKAAREIQRQRFAGTDIHCNAAMGHKEILRYCSLSADTQELLKNAFQMLHLSARSHDRVLKVARTIADLAGSESIALEHLGEAVQYRGLDRQTLSKNGVY